MDFKLIAEMVCLSIFTVQMWLLFGPLKIAQQWIIQCVLVCLAAQFSGASSLFNLYIALVFCFVLLSAWLQSSVACCLFAAYFFTPTFARVVPELWGQAINAGFLSAALWTQPVPRILAWMCISALAVLGLKRSFQRGQESGLKMSSELLTGTLLAFSFFYIYALPYFGLSLIPLFSKRFTQSQALSH